MDFDDSMLIPGLQVRIQDGLRSLHQIQILDPQGRGHAIDKAYRSRNWEQLVFLHEPVEWLAVLEKFAAEMDDRTFWHLLRRIYSTLDTVVQFRGRLEKLFNSRPADIALRIDPADAQFFDTLSDPIKIYRGYAGHNGLGFSWTMSLRIARFFAYRAQYRCRNPQIRPKLLAGLARKKDVLTLIRSRNEAELIIDPDLVSQKRRRSLGPLRGSLEDLIT